MSESSQPGGRKRLKTNPSTMPGSVMTSGRMRCSRSMTNSTIIAHANSSRCTRSTGESNSRYAPRNTAPVTISTIGYT